MFAVTKRIGCIDWCEVVFMIIPERGEAAIADIRGGTAVPGLRGKARFYDIARGTLVVAEIFGLPGSGFHGFHIHGGGSCGGEGFGESGNHYAPEDSAHPNHAGDLPPLLSNVGEAFLAVLTDRFRVEDVIGRTVVIHSMPDDFRTQPDGNAGEKIGCGEIRPCGG